mmetsp:Transcript_95436/g.274904  ORF Transcript_95436/g.274904 Transcript_95436/m.274904 type:complete len:214 (+) Transcript_95436:688-1329(+)
MAGTCAMEIARKTLGRLCHSWRRGCRRCCSCLRSRSLEDLAHKRLHCRSRHSCASSRRHHTLDSQACWAAGCRTGRPGTAFRRNTPAAVGARSGTSAGSGRRSLHHRDKARLRSSRRGGSCTSHHAGPPPPSHSPAAPCREVRAVPCTPVSPENLACTRPRPASFDRRRTPGRGHSLGVGNPDTHHAAAKSRPWPLPTLGTRSPRGASKASAL